MPNEINGLAGTSCLCNFMRSALSRFQVLTIAKAVIYRNVDKKAWEQIVKEHQGVRAVVVTDLR